MRTAQEDGDDMYQRVLNGAVDQHWYQPLLPWQRHPDEDAQEFDDMIGERCHFYKHQYDNHYPITLEATNSEDFVREIIRKGNELEARDYMSRRKEVYSLVADAVHEHKPQSQDDLDKEIERGYEQTTEEVLKEAQIRHIKKKLHFPPELDQVHTFDQAEMCAQHIEIIVYEGQVYLVLKTIRESDKIPHMSVYPIDLDTLKMGAAILSEQLMITSDPVQLAKISPKSKLFKQNGKYIFYYVVTNNVEEKVRVITLYKLDLTNGKKEAHKSYNLLIEGLHDDWKGEWNMDFTDMVIWADDVFPKEVRESIFVHQDDQNIEEWLEKQVVLFVCNDRDPTTSHIFKSLRKASDLSCHIFHYSQKNPWDYYCVEAVVFQRKEDSGLEHDLIFTGSGNFTECYSWTGVGMATLLTDKSQEKGIMTSKMLDEGPTGESGKMYKFGKGHAKKKHGYIYIHHHIFRLLKDLICNHYLEDDRLGICGIRFDGSPYSVFICGSPDSGNKIQLVKMKGFLYQNVRRVVSVPPDRSKLHPFTMMQMNSRRCGKQFHHLINNVYTDSYQVQYNGTHQGFSLSEDEHIQLGSQEKEYETYLDDKVYTTFRLQTANNDRRCLPNLVIYEDVAKQKEVRVQVYDRLKEEVVEDQVLGEGLFSGEYPCMQPSSPIQNIGRGRFRQNFQIACDRKGVKLDIFEYQYDWNEMGDPNVQLKYVGKKLLIFGKSKVDKVYTSFQPYYPDHSNQVIGGSQFMYRTCGDVLEMPNFTEHDYQFPGQICCTGYKVYYHTDKLTDNEPSALLIETRLVDSLRERDAQLSVHEKHFVYDNQINVVLNMVPAQFHNDIVSFDFDFLAPNEYFEGRSFSQSLLTDPSEVIRMLNNKKDHKRKSLLSEFMRDSAWTIDDTALLESTFLEFSSCIRKDYQVYQDLAGSNPIKQGLEYKESKKTINSCRKLIELALQGDKSFVTYNIMMAIFPFVLNSELDIVEYADFFQDFKDDGEGTNLAFKIVDNDLPKFSTRESYIYSIDCHDLVDSNILERVKNSITKEDNKIEENKEIPINHFVINFQPFLINQKISRYIQNPKKGFQESLVKDMDIAHYLLDINLKYGREIELQPCLRYTIDQLFLSKARRIVLIQFFIYATFFILPFISQVFLTDRIYINICLIICMLTTLFFFSIEVMQVQNDGYVLYLRDNANKLDLTMFLAFVAYFILRLTYTFEGKNHIVPSVIEIKNSQAMTGDWFTLLVMNVAIVIQIVMKVCFFCKVNDKFGMLVQLIVTCFQDVQAFSIFMVIWLFAFTLIFVMLGANNDVGETYIHINQFVGYFLLIWENSIGNINPPTYQFWQQKLSSTESPLELYQETNTYGIIYLIWTMWFINQALILIVLLNFLIAVISQSYENVMNSSVHYKYQQRCELIREAAIFYETFRMSSTYSIIVLQANISKEGQSGDDWAGFVQTLKFFIRGQSNKIINKIDKNSQEHKNDMNEIKALIKQMS